MKQCRGAYACVSMIAGFGIIGFRDPNGIRPVGMASRKAATGKDWLFASESIVADAGGFSDWQDLKPGTSRSPCCCLKMLIPLQPKLSLSLAQRYQDALLLSQ